MIKLYIALITIINFSFTVIAQVGINNTNPSATLDVIGTVKTDGHLFLENPGEINEIRNSNLLIRKQNGEIVKYVIGNSKYGPINFAEFVFTNVSKYGLQDYDTKISIDNYTVAIQGFSFVNAADNDPNVVIQSDTNVDNIEGYQIYAYKNMVTNTWFIKAFANNARFRYYDYYGNIYDTQVDMNINVVIYRKGFITKEQLPLTVSLNNTESTVAPLPPGF